MTDADSLEALRASLAQLKPGPVAGDDDIDSLLAACWDRFRGSNAEGMNAHKLGGRIKRLRWDPPILSFEIERHGGTVMGSSRAELHDWEVDVVKMTATCFRGRSKQLTPMSPRLHVKPFAEDVATAIRRGRPDPRLKWLSDDEVRVLIGEIMPADSAVQQTLAGRRKRFWTALDEALNPLGWQPEGRGKYRKEGGE